MKYKVTLNGKTYEVEVEQGKAVLLDEYEVEKSRAQEDVKALLASWVKAGMVEN